MYMIITLIFIFPLNKYVYLHVQILVLIAESVRAFLVVQPVYNTVPLSVRADEYQPLPTADESEMNQIPPSAPPVANYCQM